VGEIVALQAGMAVIAGLVALPIAIGAPGRLGLAIVLAAPAAGYLAPELGLWRRAARRRKVIEAELPDVLDLLRVAIAAGLAPRRPPRPRRRSSSSSRSCSSPPCCCSSPPR